MDVAEIGKVREVPIDEVIPYERNPRHNDGAVSAVAESIRQFGWQQPIVVDRDNVIIVGHTRLKAARELGLDVVPVVVADKLTDDEVRAYRIADNSTGELATWDEGLLALEVADIDLDMGAFGLTNDEHQDAAVDNLDEADDLDVEDIDTRVAGGGYLEAWRSLPHVRKQRVIGGHGTPFRTGRGTAAVCVHGSSLRGRGGEQEQGNQRDRPRQGWTHRRGYRGGHHEL